MKQDISKILNEEEIIDLSVSYSKLSMFDEKGPISLIRRTSVDNNGARLGSIVDDLLFLDKESFNEIYYLFDGEKPSATLGVLCDIILKNFVSLPSKEQVRDIAIHNKFWSNIKDPEKFIEKYDTKEFWSYLKVMFEANEKTMMTSPEFNLATDLVQILKTHEYSKGIIENEFENYNQVKFEYEYNGFKVRGIIDILSIDHKNKKVIMTDLKTGANPSSEFESSFIKWRYYLQGGIYVKAFDEICKELNLNGYTLEPFQFLYISKSDKVPLIFKMTEKWTKASFKGFNIGKYRYRGVDELLEEIYWCWKNKEYKIPKRVAEANGIVELKDNFIIVDE